MANEELKTLLQRLTDGELVPYLGAGALKGSVHQTTGQEIPADSDSLILAMNDNKPMSKRLMYEFPRAAMSVELKRGRSALQKFLDNTYQGDQWTKPPLHIWLEQHKPNYVIDINRDCMLQQSYASTPHVLIRGISRLGASQYRFVLHQHDGQQYQAINQEQVDTSLPILFKPMGSPLPDSCYIASDADYVDYITELMGGFALPSFLKSYRVGKQYLFLGLRLNRDTERMVMSDIIYSAGTPAAWALIPEPTPKERKFCKRMGITLVEADIPDLLAAA